MTNTTVPNVLYPVANAYAFSNPFVDQFAARSPGPNDVNYPIQKKWLNTATGQFYELESFKSSNGLVTANWILLGGTGVNETLTGNSGGAVPSTANNINVVGDGIYITTVGNPGTSTLTIQPAGGLTTLYTEDTGTATPSSGNLTVHGGTGIATVGSGSTITINATAAVPLLFTEDSGTATPALNNLNILGGTGITTSGSGSTVTIALSSTGGAIEFVDVDAHTAPGTNPVVPASNAITITGGQVAAGTTVNAIRTDSLAANTLTIEVQRAQAVGSSTIGDNGVSHFDSGTFAVDANGFVTLPKKAAFLAYNSADETNVTGDGTIYTITFDSLQFDQTSNFSANTFTAPLTGIYLLGFTILVTGITPSHISGGVIINTTPAQFNINTMNYANLVDGAGDLSLNGTIIVQLSATNTAKLQLQISGGTKVVNVIGTLAKTSFFGYLLQN